MPIDANRQARSVKHGPGHADYATAARFGDAGADPEATAAAGPSAPATAERVASGAGDTVTWRSGGKESRSARVP